ncbi:MAG: hypothetical protein QM831_42340 [Kofleriaceae bacterium]
MKFALLLLVLAAACGDNVNARITVDPGPYSDVLTEMVKQTPYGGLSIGSGGDFAISVVDDSQIPLEGYNLEPTGGNHWNVHAHDLLGAQYGLAAALENLGFRFRHPLDPYIPVLPKVEGQSGAHQPQVRVRGFQFHTLHPIEANFALWEPTAEGSTEDAHAIVNWAIANRANYIQWAHLDDLITDPDRYAAWLPFEKEIVDYAHSRGLRVGAELELFGVSNLQHAFDLYDDKTFTKPLADEIMPRLQLISPIAWDVYDISFGEFFNVDPDKFIASNNEVVAELKTLAPNAEVHALIHNGANQRVDYMGENLIYYFLVKFADPSIIPDIHSTFFFNLFEPADGAYGLTDFSEYRQYLLDRMCAGQKAAYHPEDAYWISFDDSVPQTYPLYIRSRWLDLSMIPQQGCGPLDEHLVFSSGWEWSYWLNDVTSMRNSYELPANYEDSIADQYAPDLGPVAAKLMGDVAETQHKYLLLGSLSPYTAGRGADIDLGRTLGIVSQPDRVTFDDLVTSGDTAGFTTNVLTPLKLYTAELQSEVDQIDDLNLPVSRWSSELADGLRVDLLRAQFITALYQAEIDHINGNDAQDAFDTARGLLTQAQMLVTSRHADLHDTHNRRLLDKGLNRTEYQYGYLFNADTLCFWNREYLQVGAILGNTSDTPMSCLF